jgi:hypothetical protein
MSTLAYCFASGQIEFGPRCPDGALPLVRGSDKKLRDFICGVARHGYATELVDGRPTKIRGTDTLLVPGVPEAPDQSEAMTALQAFMRWIAPAAKRRGLTLCGGIRP